ncbi:D-alanyl-D-alanine carboxypeptidase/D-alanyl-D-alanine-endopeptidase [Arthrobacter alpinus]|uniref:D-alanyl-D-alanine carboxypeptidase/D-alanyl-D-alanine endopeptidase n=1 Tax=Arthrobacter alpinus TaxID=656366 RepID=UPI00164860B5|nr:D-alanyl-D-alanine carboxypeptidase/D-alanyl-D-alanine-endopeptidase [Arthrobacter alpinus]
MGRTSKVVTSGLLILALAAVTVPTGMHLAPALLPKDPAAVAITPAAQLPPATLSDLTGISTLPGNAPLPDSTALTASLDNVLSADGVGQFSASVTDAVTGTSLYSRDGGDPRIPASNLKLLTAAASLKSLGGTTRMTTSVMRGATPNSLVLRAGGDAMLSTGASEPSAVMGHAGLATLAKDTAGALAHDGASGPVTLSIDDTLFTGPALNPKWAEGDVAAGEIAPIYPMALYAGRTGPSVKTGPRPEDSAVAVTEAFATALEAAGVSTTGQIVRAKAPDGTALASVSSATVAEQVQYFLVESDNYVAEVLARLVGAKEQHDASNAGATKAIKEVLTGLGLPMEGIVMADNCGLAVGNLISARQLVQTVDLMLKASGTDVGQGLVGLPIAGLSGTLGARFSEGAGLDAAGLVRAKTGTLNEVSTLSGYVINAQGRVLAFSIMGNGLSAGPASATPILDTAATILAKS